MLLEPKKPNQKLSVVGANFLHGLDLEALDPA